MHGLVPLHSPNLSLAAFPQCQQLLIADTLPWLRTFLTFECVSGFDALPPVLCLLEFFLYITSPGRRCHSTCIPPSSPLIFLIIFHWTFCLLHKKLSQFVIEFLDVSIYTACLPHKSRKAYILSVYSSTRTRLLPGCLAPNCCSVYICRLNELTLPWQIDYPLFRRWGDLEVFSSKCQTPCNYPASICTQVLLTPSLFVTLSYSRCTQRF